VAAVFFNTSGLVKRYVAEPGSQWVRQMTDVGADHRLYVSALAGPELIATLVRGARSRRTVARHLTRLLEAVETDWNTLLRSLEVDGRVILEAMRLARVYGLRGADAVHLGSALQLQRQRQRAALPGVIFVSADRDQLVAATAEALTVEDLNGHST
jgi:uncharacterized protein